MLDEQQTIEEIGGDGKAARVRRQLLGDIMTAEIDPADWKFEPIRSQIFRTQLKDGRRVTMIIEPPLK